MALLASSWLTIESIIIQVGFLIWSCIRFYIHTLFLSFCQFLLWLKLLCQWLLLSPCRLVFYSVSRVFQFLLYLFARFSLFLKGEVTNVEAREVVVNLEGSRNVYNPSHVFGSYSFSSVRPATCKLKVVLQEEGDHKTLEEEFFYEFEDEEKQMEDDENFLVLDKDITLEDEEKGMEDDGNVLVLEKDITLEDEEKAMEDDGNFLVLDKGVTLEEQSPLILISSSTNISPEIDVDSGDDQSSSLIFSTELVLEDSILSENSSSRERGEDGMNEFYNKYCGRMRWFDVLNHERACGLSATLEHQKTARRFPSWDKTAEKRLLKSIERDFELVYVAQSCLSWEALHHQYTKVKNLVEYSGNGTGGLYTDDLAGEFQKFQVLVERFLEDERCEEKRVMSFVRARLQLKGLLQVPKLSDFVEVEDEEIVKRKAVGVKEVLEAIENCIEAFHEFVKTDTKSPRRKKLRSSFWSYPPVEDPKDIELFDALTKALHQKELLLKDVQGKNRKSWFDTTPKPNLKQQFQKEEMFLILFTMIDLKLVSRVLQMSLISSSHLKWCQDKLESIQFKDCMILKVSCTFLFPSS